jgi:4'-phosphopantetheinyl transferase
MNNIQRLSVPETVPTDIEVWLVKLNLQAPISNSDFLLLSESERDRALCFHTHADQVRSTSTRAALRRLLAAKIAIPANELRLVTNQYGKPYLYDNVGIDFNVSHAGQYALIAISTTGQVGIDIENYNRQLDISILTEYVFTTLERESRLVTTEDFIRHWVAKESVLKALGVGISEHLQAVSILPDTNKSYRIESDCLEWSKIKVWLIDAPDCYAAALAIKIP